MWASGLGIIFSGRVGGSGVMKRDVLPYCRLVAVTHYKVRRVVQPINVVVVVLNTERVSVRSRWSVRHFVLQGHKPHCIVVTVSVLFSSRKHGTVLDWRKYIWPWRRGWRFRISEQKLRRNFTLFIPRVVINNRPTKCTQFVMYRFTTVLIQLNSYIFPTL